MRIGAAESGFRELPMEDHCRISKKFGFKILELGIGNGFIGRMPNDISEAKIKEYRECFKDYGLTTPFMCLENDFTMEDPEALRVEVERVLKEIELSNEFGANRIRLFAGFMLPEFITEEIWQGMVDAFKQTDEYCKQFGMQISIETHGILEEVGKGYTHYDSITTDKELLKRFLRDLPATVGINFDPGNYIPLKADSPDSYLDILGDKINYCHLKDWIQHEDGSWDCAALGDGDMDLKKILDKIKYRGVYLIEYEQPNDIEEGIARSLGYLRKNNIVFTF